MKAGKSYVMSEGTAHFFVNLSHQWSQYLLPLPFLFGAGMYLAGKLQLSTRDNPKVFLAARIFRGSSLFGLMGSFLLLGAAFMHIGCAVAVARDHGCLSNERALSLALLMYAQDSSERFPPSRQWSEGITPYFRKSELKNGEDPFHCPSAESRSGYGLNVAIGGTSLNDANAAADTVLLFDAIANIRSFAGGRSDVTLKRHSGAANIAFIDGHAKWMNENALAKVLWTPTLATTKSAHRTDSHQ